MNGHKHAVESLADVVVVLRGAFHKGTAPALGKLPPVRVRHLPGTHTHTVRHDVARACQGEAPAYRSLSRSLLLPTNTTGQRATPPRRFVSSLSWMNSHTRKLATLVTEYMMLCRCAVGREPDATSLRTPAVLHLHKAMHARAVAWVEHAVLVLATRITNG